MNIISDIIRFFVVMTIVASIIFGAGAVMKLAATNHPSYTLLNK